MSATAMREQTYHIYSGRGGGKKKILDCLIAAAYVHVTCVCYGTPRFRICNLAVATAPTYVCTDTKLILLDTRANNSALCYPLRETVSLK